MPQIIFSLKKENLFFLNETSNRLKSNLSKIAFLQFLQENILFTDH